MRLCYELLVALTLKMSFVGKLEMGEASSEGFGMLAFTLIMT